MTDYPRVPWSINADVDALAVAIRQGVALMDRAPTVVTDARFADAYTVVVGGGSGEPAMWGGTPCELATFSYEPTVVALAPQPGSGDSERWLNDVTLAVAAAADAQRWSRGTYPVGDLALPAVLFVVVRYVTHPTPVATPTRKAQR